MIDWGLMVAFHSMYCQLPLDKMPDVILKGIFVKEKFCILIWISLFVLKGPIGNKSALGQVMVGTEHVMLCN